MAKPIKPTPVINGKDAKKFMEELRQTENEKIPPGQLDKMRQNYSKFIAIAH